MDKCWTFHNPVHIHFGRGCRKVLLEELAGKRCLIVTTKRGRTRFLEDSILGSLSRSKHIEWLDSVVSNPSITDLQQSIDRFSDIAFDAIVAFGGGSAIDSAKVLSVALSPDICGIRLVDLLAKPKLHRNARPCPVYAVPTTAGTGSEVTPYSTVWDYGSRKKYSLSGPAVYAYAAVVDPALTDELPKEVTLTTGLDAINQALESVWNRNATSLTISIAARALQLGLQSLPSLQMDGGNSVDRDNMAECSLLAGLAISQTRTALCHSISYPLTSHFNVPHGLACAFTMPPVFRLNRSFDDTRFKQLACCMGCQDIDELDESVDRLVKELKVVERVRGFIPSMEKLRDLSSEMYTPGRADNNLAPVDENVITRILDCAYNDDRCW